MNIHCSTTGIVITIESGNAAFSPDPSFELARILRDLADRVERDGSVPDGLPLRDVNGNTVGRVRAGEDR